MDNYSEIRSDKQTNFLYLSGLLPVRFPRFFADLVQILDESNIIFDLLPETKDIWVKDFMPIQVKNDLFIRFIYDPIYLKPKKWAGTRTDNNNVCDTIGLKTRTCNINVDGGNIVRSGDTVIMTDRVFDENFMSEQVLLNNLKSVLNVSNIIVIPAHPDDLFGHADGWVRFIDEHTVVINDLSKEDPFFSKNLLMVLQNAGLHIITIPYNPYDNVDEDSALGVYINYLEMQDLVVIPTFNMTEDHEVLQLFHKLFPDRMIHQIDCTDIAKEGGVLNCISWGIYRNTDY